jgi:hypothetical protein
LRLCYGGRQCYACFMESKKKAKESPEEAIAYGLADGIVDTI